VPGARSKRGEEGRQLHDERASDVRPEWPRGRFAAGISNRSVLWDATRGPVVSEACVGALRAWRIAGPGGPAPGPNGTDAYDGSCEASESVSPAMGIVGEPGRGGGMGRVTAQAACCPA
jgi:hypothetical protein